MNWRTHARTEGKEGGIEGLKCPVGREDTHEPVPESGVRTRALVADTFTAAMRFQKPPILMGIHLNFVFLMLPSPQGIDELIASQDVMVTDYLNRLGIRLRSQCPPFVATLLYPSDRSGENVKVVIDFYLATYCGLLHHLLTEYTVEGDYIEKATALAMGEETGGGSSSASSSAASSSSSSSGEGCETSDATGGGGMGGGGTDGGGGEGSSDSGGEEGGGGIGPSGNPQGVDLILDGELTDAACSELHLPAGINFTVYIKQKKETS